MLQTVYRTRGISRQILMDLNIPLEDAILPFPMSRIQQAAIPFLGIVTLNSASQGLFPSADTNIAPKDRHLPSMEKAVCWEGVLECNNVTRHCHSHFLLWLSAEVIRRADKE